MCDSSHSFAKIAAEQQKQLLKQLSRGGLPSPKLNKIIILFNHINDSETSSLRVCQRRT